jgi:hypothetical protein
MDGSLPKVDQNDFIQAYVGMNDAIRGKYVQRPRGTGRAMRSRGHGPLDVLMRLREKLEAWNAITSS